MNHLLLLVVFVGAFFWSAKGVYLHLVHSTPVDMSCAQFLAEGASHTVVRLKDCYVRHDDFSWISSHDESGALVSQRYYHPLYAGADTDVSGVMFNVVDKTARRHLWKYLQAREQDKRDGVSDGTGAVASYMASNPDFADYRAFEGLMDIEGVPVWKADLDPVELNMIDNPDRTGAVALIHSFQSPLGWFRLLTFIVCSGFFVWFLVSLVKESVNPKKPEGEEADRA